MLSQLLHRQDGVITRRQALRFLTTKALAWKVKSERWQRIDWGVYLARPGPVTPSQRQWAAVLALGGDRHPPRACLAGLSSLCAWGLQLVRPNRTDVLVIDGHPVRRRRGVAIHLTSPRPPVERASTLLPPVTLPGRSLVDAVAWARTDQEARLIIAASFQQRIVTLADVHHEVCANTRRRPLLLSVAADCAGGSHSIGELDLLRLCRKARLPLPSRQVPRLDRRGRMRYLDVLFEPWKVAVEIDGVHHLDVAHFWDDAQRANELELDGYVVLRYPAHVVRAEPARVIADLRIALRNAGWRR